MLLANCKVLPSLIHGRGLFAVSDIPRGTWLYVYAPRTDRKRNVKGATKKQLHFGYISPRDGKLVICGDRAKWWNFGFPPNSAEVSSLRVNGEGIVVATRDIKAGEELLISVDTDLDSKRKLML